MSPSTVVAERIELTGVVQGVGMRPFVHRLACELGLDGRVGNDTGTVFIEVTGPADTIDELVTRLASEAPPLAHIESLRRQPGPAWPEPGFHITDSRVLADARTAVPPDTAVCDRCLAELFDPSDRRYRHPFITCTDCGPRLTIVTGLPYDRAATTMAGFTMCASCRREYTDPTNRRFHAQPIACHHCGPVLSLRRGASPVGGDPIAEARAALAAGSIVAVKGLGGYHLAADATSDAAVAELRRRKHRPDKPLAVMTADLDAARRLAHIDEAEAALLTSPARPIVLLRTRTETALSPAVAPNNPLVGVLLAYTPVHHLLLEATETPLVMTSANVGGEPIIHHDDHPALAQLADAVLAHDRPIHVRCDDSVVRVADGQLMPIRRARGYAPVPVGWANASRTTLAVGGELKNTFCLASTDHAWVSPHLGDMGTVAAQTSFESIEATFRALYAVEPDVVAVDAHP
ncbi:MAG: carbamoyltransferase HypF, partial [Acidimicrobiia bacterium]|nr:carbamoyltransferase HypF [Acidimicrobiia bacterium]